MTGHASANRPQLTRRSAWGGVHLDAHDVNTSPPSISLAAFAVTDRRLGGRPNHSKSGSRVQSGARAIAAVRGNADLKTPLGFVRFEPFVVPNKSLTGDSTERVDTRVLQVIYKIEDTNLPLFAVRSAYVCPARMRLAAQSATRYTTAVHMMP